MHHVRRTLLLFEHARTRRFSEQKRGSDSRLPFTSPFFTSTTTASLLKGGQGEGQAKTSNLTTAHPAADPSQNQIGDF